MNPETINSLNIVLGLGAIGLQIASALALFMLAFGPKKNFYLDFIDKNFLAIGFVVSLTASLFSLVYSEIIGFLPCYLCWYQRIFLFPVVFIFGLGMWNKDRSALRYSLPLLVVGFVISIYQNFFYYFADTGNIPCDASGVSCYQQLVSVFGGYISIPMLALTVFFALLSLLTVTHFYNKKD